MPECTTPPSGFAVVVQRSTGKAYTELPITPYSNTLKQQCTSGLIYFLLPPFPFSQPVCVCVSGSSLSSSPSFFSLLPMKFSLFFLPSPSSAVLLNKQCRLKGRVGENIPFTKHPVFSEANGAKNTNASLLHLITQ